MSKFYHVIVIGAGPAGMTAAITAAKNRKRVLLIEQMDKLGKKILATGNGKCNFTNDQMDSDMYYGNSELIQTVLKQYTKDDLLRFFHEMGILPKCKNGYYYPNSEQASSVVKAFEKELHNLLVDIVLETKVTDLVLKKNKYEISTSQEEYSCEKVIFATGLLASPKLGSNGSCFDVIKNCGHRFTKIVPALCGFYCEGMDFKKVAGVRAEGIVSVLKNNQECASEFGEIQFTEYGVSGIPVFQISHVISKELSLGGHVAMQINLFPGHTKEDMIAELKYRKYMLGEDATLSELWNGLLNEKLAPSYIKHANLQIHMPLSKITESDLEQLAETLLAYPIEAYKSRDFEFAQVCAGGISDEEIYFETLESKYNPGMFFAGEVLDVDGVCGGYNIQWAVSTGYIAGINASKDKDK